MSEADWDLIALIIALVCFVLATLGVTHPRVAFLAMGLAFWVTVPLVAAIRAH